MTPIQNPFLVDQVTSSHPSAKYIQTMAHSDEAVSSTT